MFFPYAKGKLNPLRGYGDTGRTNLCSKASTHGRTDGQTDGRTGQSPAPLKRWRGTTKPLPHYDFEILNEKFRSCILQLLYII